MITFTVGSSINPLAALIAPLAGLALLGAASAVAVNPVLLQLVTIKKGRRRRRDVGSGIFFCMKTIQISENNKQKRMNTANTG